MTEILVSPEALRRLLATNAILSLEKLKDPLFGRIVQHDGIILIKGAHRGV